MSELSEQPQPYLGAQLGAMLDLVGEVRHILELSGDLSHQMNITLDWIADDLHWICDETKTVLMHVRTVPARGGKRRQTPLSRNVAEEG